MKNVVAIALLLVSASYAQANSITQKYGFQAVGFPDNAPVAAFSGDFTVTFESITGNGVNVATLDEINLSIGSINYNLSSTALYVQNGRTNSTYGHEAHIWIGGALSGIGGMGSNQDDFLLRFTDFGSDIYSPGAWTSYSSSALPGFYGATTVDVFRVAEVPEPETYALFLAALGLLGVTARHRKMSA